MKFVHLFPNGRFDRGVGCSRNRFVQRFSKVLENGASAPYTRREWYAMGKQDGFTCKFYPNMETARDALK